MSDLKISIRPDHIANGNSAPVLFVTLPNRDSLQTPVTVADLEWVCVYVRDRFGFDARPALKAAIAELASTDNYLRWMAALPEAVEEWAAFEIEHARTEAAIVLLDEALAQLDADRLGDVPVYLLQAAE